MNFKDRIDCDAEREGQALRRQGAARRPLSARVNISETVELDLAWEKALRRMIELKTGGE